MIRQKRTETHLFLILASRIGECTRQGLKREYEGKMNDFEGLGGVLAALFLVGLALLIRGCA